jgi:fatty-acyl-CoA synthase
VNIPLSPLEFIRRTRKLHSTREALVDAGLRLTYAAFLDRCDRWASTLRRFGVKHGDRVAYISNNTHAMLEAYHAVPQLGAVLVPLNFRLTADDFAYMIDHSGARAVCVAPDYLDAVDGIRASLTKVEHFVSLEQPRPGWLDYESLLAEASPEFEPVTVAEDDLLTINYTSGTTASPKGVMITHRNAWVNVVGTLVHSPLSCADRYLWTLPMFHANGWTYVWVVTAVGGTHVCLRKVEPIAIFDLIKRERVTKLCAAPTVLIGIANAPEEVRQGTPRGVRVKTAGAPPAAATIERIEEELGWFVEHLYGLTETSPFMTFSERWPEHAALSRAERSAMLARQGVEQLTAGDVRVIDEQGHDVPRDGQSLGEIVVRGNVVMKGYYNDPEATERAFAGGHFHSGDAAVVHPDGFIEVRDRFKDVIISGGENISSIEVESALLRHPGVMEVAVVGLPHEKWGEAPHAFVVLRPGASATEAELIAFARERLAGFKIPKGVTFIAELPKTATGKVQKYVLRGGKAAIARQ